MRYQCAGMSGFFFTFLAVILAGLGARDQATVAELTQMQGKRPGVLAVAVAVSVVTAVVAAWVGSALVPLLAGKARATLAVLALGLAGAESLLLRAGRKPEEPTLSLGALAIVLLAHQLADSARLLVFAVAVASAAPLPAGIGGAVGGTVVVAAAWAWPEHLTARRLRLPRRAVGAGLLLLAALLALRILG